VARSQARCASIPRCIVDATISLDPGFQHAVEELAVETLSLQDRVEALPACVLSGSRWIDVMRLSVLSRTIPQLKGNELRTDTACLVGALRSDPGT